MPHEQTLTKPKEDRLNHLRSTLLDSGLIFMLYSDPTGKIEEEIDQLVTESASWSAKSDDSCKNKIWKISDPDSIVRIQKLLQDKPVIIADGHHVDPVMLSVAVAAKITGRMMLVTDATAPVGTNSEIFQMSGQSVTVKNLSLIHI